MAPRAPKRQREDDRDRHRRVEPRRGERGSELDYGRPEADRQAAYRHDQRQRDRSRDASSRKGHPPPTGGSHAAKKVTIADQADDGADDLVDYDREFELAEDDTERILEESRKRRQAILAKYSSSSQSVTPQPPSDTPSVQDFALAKADNAMPATSGPSMSAADYDPALDRAQDDQRKLDAAEQEQRKADQEEYEEIEVDDDDEVDDMFALDDDAPKKKKKVIRVAKGGSAALAPVLSKAGAGPDSSTLQDNWDDPDGYYHITLGEVLDNGRYQVFANLGRGMFASVVRARDLQDKEREVAIKIVRVQETMYKAGLKEIGILKKLVELDPEDKKHVVRLEGHFEHRGHLCMVFESLSMNLREVVKRFGKDVGLNLSAVKVYAHQMFQALSLFNKANLMHADIKPDNILINDAKTLLKICDLGSASDLSEMEITPYLVSRFYRAPEIILGQPYDGAIDVWSVGCTLYELGTGKILFVGRTNNQMLLLMQELKGRFTTKQVRKSRFGAQHFDDTNAFLSQEKDKSTGQEVVRRVVMQKPVEDLRAKLLPGDAAKRLKDDELKRVLGFVDLLNRCLELDPAKRITPKEALSHPFLC